MEQGGEVDPSIVPQPQRIVTSRSTFTCQRISNFQYENKKILKTTFDIVNRRRNDGVIPSSLDWSSTGIR